MNFNDIKDDNLEKLRNDCLEKKNTYMNYGELYYRSEGDFCLALLEKLNIERFKTKVIVNEKLYTVIGCTVYDWEPLEISLTVIADSLDAVGYPLKPVRYSECKFAGGDSDE